MKERYVVIITLVLLLTAAAYWIWSNNRPPNMRLDEMFSDSTYSGKIYFGFVSVDRYDKSGMREFGRNFLSKYVTLDMLRKDLPVISVVHFYNPDDSMPLTDDLITQIKKTYPYLKDINDKLQCVKGGYIFTGFSKKLKNLNVPKDTLFQTTVIIPKAGIKAKDVLKIKRKSTSSDSTQVIENDTTGVKK